MRREGIPLTDIRSHRELKTWNMCESSGEHASARPLGSITTLAGATEMQHGLRTRMGLDGLELKLEEHGQADACLGMCQRPLPGARGGNAALYARGPCGGPGHAGGGALARLGEAQSAFPHGPARGRW